jgi:molybdenum cofactor cytidylyltransferase
VISAIVLAAGEATRFGRSKQLEPIEGRPLLQRVIDSLARTRVDEAIVVLGAFAEVIRGAISFGAARVVLNSDYAQGMSTSLHAGLRAIRRETDAALFVLGDQPFVAPSTIDALIAAYENDPSAIIVPTYDGRRGNPVLVGRALFPRVMEIRGDVGCRAIFAEHAVTELAVDDHGVIADIDTAEDIEWLTRRSK